MKRHLVCSLILLSSQLLSQAENTKLTPLPEGFSSFGATKVGDSIYVYGGHAGKTHSYSWESTLGKLRRLDLKNINQGWQELGEGEHLQGLALVTYKDTIIRVGGMSPKNKQGEARDNASITAVRQYHPDTKKWTDLAPLPNGRSSHDAIILADTLYVFGGWQMLGKEGESNWHDHGLKLDLTNPNAKWEKVTQSFERRALTVQTLDQKIYVVGGLSSEGSTTKEVDIYDPKTNSWSKGPELPGGKMNGFTPATTVLEGQLIASPADGKVYRLTGNAWQPIGTLNKQRMVHRLVAISDSKIAVLGGASKEGNIAEVEVIDLNQQQSNAK